VKGKKMPTTENGCPYTLALKLQFIEWMEE